MLKSGKPNQVIVNKKNEMCEKNRKINTFGRMMNA